MRYTKNKKISHSADQSWGILFGVVVSIAALSLLVLVLMGMGITGFVVVTPEAPTSVNLTLTERSYPQQSIVEGDFFAQFDGPIDQYTAYYATLNNNRYSLRLTQALDAQNISYQLSSTAPEVQNTTPSTTLLFPGRSVQHFTLQLPRSVTIQNLDMNIHGLAEEESYPSFLKMDANRDGQFEWEYVGVFDEFDEDFILPAGLHENQESSLAIITEQPAFYCEVIDLPSGRDFLVSAKYHPLQLSSAADLEIVLFSVSGSGASLTGTGGTEVCDLEEHSASSVEYRSCHLALDYPVQGNHLLCVHNAGLTLAAGDYYELSRDSDRNSGYRCGAISNGRTTCTQQTGDFFIKVQGAIYDGILDRQVSLAEGAPETLLKQKLQEQLNACAVSSQDFCYLTVDMQSDTQGSVYLDDLDIIYSDIGTIIHEHNFYTLASSPGVIISLANVSLLDSNYTLTLPLALLDILTPNVTSSQSSRNYTLTVGLSPGPSISTPITVTANGTTATYTGNFTGDIVFYQELLTSSLDEYADILTIGGFKTKIDSTLQLLSKYISLSTTTNNTSNTSLAQLEDEIMDSLDVVPQYIATKGSSTFTPSVSTSDFKDDYVYASQKSDEQKQRLAYLQQQYAPTITATTFEILTFKKQSTLFTVVEHGTSAFSGAGKMITIFPSSFASTLSSISFTEDPVTTHSTTPLTVAWGSASLPDTMRYVVKGNLLSASENIRVLFIPETFPIATEQPRTTCGDEVCSVLLINGQKIALEDKASCPADCGSETSWTWIIVILVLVVVVYAYFSGMYKGPGNFQDILQRFKKQGTKLSSSKLFSSSADETNLKNYVQSALNKGVTKEAITSTLLNRGWTRQQIDAVLKQVKP